MDEDQPEHNPFESNKDKHGRITMLSEELSRQLVDKTLMKKYGTSMAEGMNKNYSSKIRQKYYELEQQFNQIDINKDAQLTIQEFSDFFGKHQNKKDNILIDNNYIQRLFSLLDKDKNNVISIEEFVFAYIGLEEKLHLKQISLNLLNNDLTKSLNKYKLKVQETENEAKNKEGVCENASLSVTLFEAKDLRGKSSIQSRNIYVVFSLDGSKKQISSVKHEDSPIWNEDFGFPISKKNEEFLIEVYDKGTLIGNTLIGSVKLQLSLFDHQLKTENWYPLTLGSTPDDFGSIHLQFRYIYSYHKFYIDLVEKTNSQIIRLKEDLKELNEYQDQFKEPFGIVLAGKINSIIEKRMFEKSEDVIDYIASTRKSIYIPSKKENKMIVMNNSNSILFSGLDSIEWPMIAVILLLLSCGLSLLTFFTKADYINLLILVGAFVIIMTDAKYELTTYLKTLSYGLIGVSVCDLAWILFHYGSWNYTINYNSSTLLCTFIFVALSCGSKCGLAYYCYTQDNKLTTIKKKGQNEIISTNLG